MTTMFGRFVLRHLRGAEAAAYERAAKWHEEQADAAEKQGWPDLAAVYRESAAALRGWRDG